MPRLPTIRVIGSQAISTSWPGSRFAWDGSGMIVVIELCSLSSAEISRRAYQVRRGAGGGFLPLCRHFGSLSTVRAVTPRRLRINEPYSPDAVVETLPPGGSSMNGMNLSGNPGMVHPRQMPPTFGQPPIPLIQPRFGTLHLTTGPQQPSLTMHFGDPYSVAKSPCS